MNLSRAAYYRAAGAIAKRDEPVIEALNGIVAKHSRWGFWKCHERLRLDGYEWNHKRTWRIYCAMRLNLPRPAPASVSCGRGNRYMRQRGLMKFGRSIS